MRLDPVTLPAPPAEGAPTRPVNANPAMLALLATRRSSKPFHLAEPGPDRAQIAALLTLAARCPDHGKLAPWRFIVIAGEARARLGDELAAIAANQPGASEATIDAARAQLQRSPVVVAVVSTAAPHAKIPEWEQILSAGAVCYNLILAAEGLGFGGVWLTGWAAYDARAKAALGVTEAERVAGFIYLGTQTQSAEERPRPDVAKLTTWA
ncbi:MAG: nitroreductase family protein [Caulobacterales bacterium]|jgi:nitroreductase